MYFKYADTKTNTSLWCTQVQTDYIKDSIYQSKTSFLVSSVSLSSSDAVAVLWSEWVWQQILMTGISSNWRMLALQTLQQSPNTRSGTDWDTQPRLCNQYNTHLVPFDDFSRSNRVRVPSCLWICIVNLSSLVTPLVGNHRVWVRWSETECQVRGGSGGTEETRGQPPDPPQPHLEPHLSSLAHLNLSPSTIT